MLRTLRFQNWWIAKIPPLLSYAYAVIFLLGLSLVDQWLNLILLVVWMIGAAAFGHYINDIFDLDDDLQAGKHNSTESHSTAKKALIVIGLLVLVCAPWIVLPKTTVNLALVAGHLLVFILYSAPPVRLKERGILAVFADAVYAHVIPGLVVVTTMLHSQTLGDYAGILILFTVWQLIIGCRNILNHHIDDYENDMRSNTVTTATIYGDSAVKATVKRIFFPLEVIALLAMLYVLPKPFPVLAWVYLGYIAYTFNREVTFLREKLMDKVIIKGRYDYLSGILLNEFYEKWLPLIVLVWLSLQDWSFWILMAVHIILFIQIIITFKKDVYFVIYLFYEIVRQSYFFVQKPVKHFFLSIVPTVRNMSYWKVKIFIQRTTMGIYWFFKRNAIRTYWHITVFFRRLYWGWMRLYRDHIVRIAWIFIKLYYRIEYKLWKMFYKPLKDKWKGSGE